MTHVLVTNDDGVTHPGLAALAAALRTVGDVTVLAPDRNWSASGHVKTLHKPLRVRPAVLADGSPALASNGAPSDCVALAVLGVVEAPIDLVVSGVNPAANVGHDLTYSGTVTAAMEAAISGIPGIAVSADAAEVHGYAAAADFAARLARETVARGLPPFTLLNVNLPALAPDAIRGVRVTRQGLRTFLDFLERRTDPRGETYYWIGGEPTAGPHEPGSDLEALRDGFISVTPIQMDLTARDFAGELGAWPLGGTE